MSVGSLKDAVGNYGMYSDTCLAYDCEYRGVKIDTDFWDTWAKPPVTPPPSPPSPDIRQAEPCLDAAVETVDAGIAWKAADDVCGKARSKAGAIMCGAAVIYTAIRTTSALIKGSNCPAPSPEPPAPRPKSYYGW